MKRVPPDARAGRSAAEAAADWCHQLIRPKSVLQAWFLQPEWSLAG
jgi:hypothetical protein